MAISWGAWEYSGGNGMRVGLDVSWAAGDGGSIDHNTVNAVATVKVYTENQYSINDQMTLNYSGSIGGSQGFNNTSGANAQVLRDTVTYTYAYPSTSYGSSPGSRTFTASISGAYNGVTPSKSVTSNIPARPIAAPAAPTNVHSSRISDSSIKTTWTNKDSDGAPWSSMDVQIDLGANDVWNDIIASPSGTATSYTDTGLSSNYAYRYRVRASNSAGDSSWVQGDLIYTTPAAPDTLTVAPGTGSQLVVTWTNRASVYMNYLTEVWVSRDGGTTWSLLTTAAQGSTGQTQSYTDTAASASQKTGYKVRHKTNGGVQGTLYSAYSANSAFTAGVTSPPNAPTQLAPTNNAMISPKFAKDMTWQFNPTDTSTQVAYQTQWRVQGAATWTTQAKVTSGTAKWTAPANTFDDNSTIEWQVRTWGGATTGGADGTGASAWSASSLFKTAGDPNVLRDRKRVTRLNLDTGQFETAGTGVLPPVGSMMLWPGETAPPGWLLAEGGTYDSNVYPGLFGVLGTTTLPRRDPEWPSIDQLTGNVTAASGYAMGTFNILKRFPNGMVSFRISVTRTGAAVSLTNPEHVNQKIAQINDPNYYPIHSAIVPIDSGLRTYWINTNGDININSGIANSSFTSASINTNDQLNAEGIYWATGPGAGARMRWIIKAE